MNSLYFSCMVVLGGKRFKLVYEAKYVKYFPKPTPTSVPPPYKLSSSIQNANLSPVTTPLLPKHVTLSLHP